jgi:serpin B
MDLDREKLSEIAKWPGKKLRRDTEAVRLLVHALGDDDGARTARKALERLRGRVRLDQDIEAELVRHLRSNADSRVRALAANLVQRAESKSSREALVEAIVDEEKEVREAAALALRMRSDDVAIQEEVKKVAQEYTGEKRAAALEALPAHPVDDKWLARFIEDPHWEVQLRAVKLMMRSGAEIRDAWGEPFRKVAVEILTEDEDSWARYDAARHLAGTKDEPSISALLNGTKDPESDVRSACAEALAECDGAFERIREPGLRLLCDTRTSQAALVLLSTHAEEALDEVTAILESKLPWTLAMDILPWLGKRGKSRAWPTIRRWVTASDTDLASWVQPDEEMNEVTGKAASNEDLAGGLRATAIVAAGLVGSDAQEIVPFLCECMERVDFSGADLDTGFGAPDPVTGLRSYGPAAMAVVEALGNIGIRTPAVRQALTKAFAGGKDSPHLRVAIIKCLHQLQAFDAQTIEVLLNGLGDEDDTVRETAKEIISFDGKALSIHIKLCRSREELRPLVLEALWLAGDPPDDAVQELARRLGEEEPRRTEALGALRQLGQRATVASSELRHLAISGATATRCAAFTVLGPLTTDIDAELAEAWVEAIEHSTVELRLAATAALGERLEVSRELHQALTRRLADDEDTSVRDAARWAIARHDKPTAGSDAAALPIEWVNRLGCQILGRGSGQANNVCSPLSIYLVLAALERGASGRTREELQKLVGLEPAVDTLLASLPRPDDEQGFAFETATGLFVDNEHPIVEDYAEAYRQLLQGHQERLDLTVPGARSHVNNWVCERTGGRIPVLFDAIPEETRFLLANATYFKALWTHPFLTGEQGLTITFHCLDGGCVKVPAMYESLECRYAKGPWCEAVELDYRPGRTAMVIVVPQLGFFERVRSIVTDGELAALLSNLEPEYLALTLPKFEFSLTLRLKQLLREMGVGAVFDQPNLSRMSPAREMGAYNEIIHKSFIRVDEKGTEAAAATGIVGVGHTPPPPLIVDRPFVFFIRDVESQTMLFCGQVVLPSATSDR